MDNQVARDRELLVTARQRGRLPLLGAFVKLSGPGWLQGAITLGGGSLAGSLYLGVLSGYSMLWLQIVAIGFGVVMLSAIAYVTLATGQRPFKAINEHVNPVLGWGWAIATMIANMVWLMPQFSLATGAIQQNLLPQVASSFGEPAMMTSTTPRAIITLAIFLVSMVIVWSYHQGGRGIRLFENLLKLMVAIVILSFVGVVITLAGQLPWDQIGWGLIPNPSLLSKPAATWTPLLDNIDTAYRALWENRIVSSQRDVMITVVATAVGINMTFFLPYSMLARGWDREFRGLAIFDLSTGLLIPFVLATGCVVIASASQFHTQPAPGLIEMIEAPAATDGNAPAVSDRIRKDYFALIDVRLAEEHQKRWPNVSQGERMVVADYALRQKLGEKTYEALSEPERRHRAMALSESELAPFAGRALVSQIPQEQKLRMVPVSERLMAATLVTRDANDLANTLTPLTGKAIAHLVFGVGVMSMALSTIIMLMLINGFVLCEMCDRPGNVTLHRIGALIAACSGMLGPFFWSKASFWMAVPTSVFNFSLLPVAYITFAILMNQRSLLGQDIPRGGKRVLWNVLMASAASVVLVASLWSIWSKAGYWGLGAMGAFVLLAGIFHVFVPRKPLELAAAPDAAVRVQTS